MLFLAPIYVINDFVFEAKSLRKKERNEFA